MSDMTLGNGLIADPTEPLDYDLPALGWEATQYRMTWEGRGTSAYALVSRVGRARDANPWHLHCTGPGSLAVSLDGWHPTAAAAQAAVAAHIAAHLNGGA